MSAAVYTYVPGCAQNAVTATCPALFLLGGATVHRALSLHAGMRVLCMPATTRVKTRLRAQGLANSRRHRLRQGQRIVPAWSAARLAGSYLQHRGEHDLNLDGACLTSKTYVILAISF